MHSLGRLAQRGNEAEWMEQTYAGKEEEKDGLRAREREEGIFHLPIFSILFSKLTQTRIEFQCTFYSNKNEKFW